MYRLITISGLSFTGKTSFSKKLATLLNWQCISAGQRFRDLCAAKGILITDIPKNDHIELDDKIKTEILNDHDTIIEGHYLGIFSKNISSVLKVLLVSDIDRRAV